VRREGVAKGLAKGAATIFRFARKVNFPAVFLMSSRARPDNVLRRRILALVYLMLYLTGTVSVTLDPISGGNGRPLAFRAISSAAWSRIDDPELAISRADMTWPLRPIVMASRTVPCSRLARAASG
jgi:hypothetical protein